MAKRNSVVEFRTKLHKPSSTHKYEFKWHVENISQLAEDESFESPKFYPIPNSQWYGKITRYDDILMYSIESETKTNPRVRIKASFTDLKGSEFSSITSDLIIKIHSNTILDCTSLFGDSKIFKRIRLDKDTMIVHTKIEFFDSKMTTSVVSEKDSKDEVLIKLSHDFKKLYEKSLNTDITFRIENKTLKAHKGILRIRSKTFERMFEFELELGDIVHINDISYDIMNEFFNFLYSGIKKEYDYVTARDLYYAAYKYEVEDLQIICADSLVKLLTPENFCSVLISADERKDVYLRKQLVGYARENFDVIFSSDKWEKLVSENANLANEFVKSISKKSVAVNKT